jgi:hypothetical protein
MKKYGDKGEVLEEKDDRRKQSEAKKDWTDEDQDELRKECTDKPDDDTKPR